MFKHKSYMWLFVILVICILTLTFFMFWDRGGLVRAPTEPMPGCVVVNDNGDSDNSIDIVFLGANYDSVDEFISDTYVWSDALMSVEPYSSYTGRFNFFRVETFGDYGCEWNEGYILCNTGKVMRASSICPHDYFVVLTDIEGIETLAYWLRSSYYQKVMAINTADDKLVLAHEAGHAFGDFAEEYTEEGSKIWWDAPNCDSKLELCPKFEGVEGTDCIQGCTNFQYSRATKEGIMRDYWIRGGKTYGVFDEYILEQFLLSSTGPTLENNPIEPGSVLIVDISCEGENCTIDSVEESYGFSDGDNSLVEDSDLLKLVVNGSKGEGRVKVGDSTKLFTETKEFGILHIFDFKETYIIKNPGNEGEIVDIELYGEDGDLISSYNYEVNGISSMPGPGGDITIPSVS